MSIITRQEEGKLVLEHLQKTSLPREMVTVRPKKGTEEGDLVVVQDSDLKRIAGSKYEDFYGTALPADITKRTAEQYSTQQDGQLLVVGQGTSKDITLTPEITSNRTQQHLLIVVEQNATLTLMHVLDENIAKGNHEIQIEIVAQENSNVDVTLVQHCTTNVRLSYNRGVRVMENATFHAHDVLIGANFQEHVSIVYLEGKHAVGKQIATVYGDDQRFLLTQHSQHIVGETESDITSKAVLQNGGQAGFKGLVGIKPHASNSEGYQQMDVLLMDSQSKASAIPELDIQTDQVQCSHGATIGELDQDQLFYLQSRGLPESQAIKLLLIGFLTEGISHLNKQRQEHILRIIQERFDNEPR